MMKEITEFVLFIGGLSPQLTNIDLLNYFKQFGGILKAKIITDKKTNIPKGYAYVTCKDNFTFTSILGSRHEIMGRDVDVQVAHSGTKIVSDVCNQMNKKLCVKNLTLDTVQTELLSHFKKYGKVKHAYIIINHQTKKSKQFGYVEFYNEKDCNAAMLGCPHNINGHNIECEKFIHKAIEKNNKKNLDDKVIMEKFKGLKEKENEAIEKKLNSPCKVPLSNMNNNNQKRKGNIILWDESENYQTPHKIGSYGRNLMENINSKGDTFLNSADKN